jgi:hypothetical protein
VVLAGLAVAAGRALALGQNRELARLATALVVTAAAGAPLTLWQTGGGEGYTGIVRFAPATVFSTSAFAGALVRAAGADALPPTLVVPGFALWLVGYLGLAGVAGMLWLARHRAPLSTPQVFSLGVVAAGILLRLVLDVPGLSQLFLVYNGQLLLFLRRRRAPRGARLAVATASALVAGALVLPFRAGEPRSAGARAARVGAIGPGAAAHAPTRSSAITPRDSRGCASMRAATPSSSRTTLVAALGIGEVRLYHENGLYTVRAWQAQAPRAARARRAAAAPAAPHRRGGGRRSATRSAHPGS